MDHLAKESDIWVLKPVKNDLKVGAEYASISLPWTFNRMMLNTTSKGQQGRALNVAKGIVGQEMLRRKLREIGVKALLQRKSYRDEDLFDFRINQDGKTINLDVKSVNFYTNYDPLGRAPLSSKLIIENMSYPGPDWRKFFPMLVPHTQINQDKEAYCFAIASSVDLRKDIDTNRLDYALTAFPSGDFLVFCCSKKLCLAREDAHQGFYVRLRFVSEGLFSGDALTLHLLGEWEGVKNEVKVELKAGAWTADLGPLSCLSGLRIDRNDFGKLDGSVQLMIGKNDFMGKVYNSAMKNQNVKPASRLEFCQEDFCNLMLPSDYTLYVLGWLPKQEFLARCRKYTGWVWPNDAKNRFHNQSWSQITDADKKAVQRGGFEDCVQTSPRLLKAGWLKTNGRGGGACCYVFPNIGMNGGVKETNLYVLPQDLSVMNSLGISKG